MDALGVMAYFFGRIAFWVGVVWLSVIVANLHIACLVIVAFLWMWFFFYKMVGRHE